jgi:hypothetical protein
VAALLLISVEASFVPKPMSDDVEREVQKIVERA